MGNVFLELANRSINASWLVLAIVLLRRLLKKSPKKIIIMLWALVGIRLICPFSPESVLSLIPDPDPISTEFLQTEHTPPPLEDPITVPNIGGPAVTRPVNPTRPVGSVEAVTEKVGTKLDTVQVLTAVWAIGMLVLLTYLAVSSLHLRRKLKASIPLYGNIRLCDYIGTPFLLGVFRPRIYLPSSLNAEDAKYAIAHERAHLMRHDNWWKLLGFLLLTVFWFNPLMWIAHALFCRDIELACDEEVIRKLGSGSKKSYLNALINCSVPHRAVTFRPLAFGEIAVKERVKMILQYKKSKLWLNIISLCVCVVLAFCFLTNPISAVDESVAEPTDEVQSTIETPAETSSTDQIVEKVEEPEKVENNEKDDSDEIDPELLESYLNDFVGTPEEIKEFFTRVHRVFNHRIQTWYSNHDFNVYDNIIEGPNYTLPKEIVEKYGTDDSEGLPSILVYESIGEFDSTETIELQYGKRNEKGLIERVEGWTETVTIKIPAGGVAFYVIECPFEGGVFAGFAIRGGTYGDCSVSFDEFPQLKEGRQ